MFMLFKKIDEKGQAIIEFFMFLPLILIMFLVTITIAASINGSINQIKSVRGYFYFLVKSNTKIPTPQDLQGLYDSGGLKMIGMHTLGWMDYQDGREAVASCYKLEELVSKDASDTCEDTDAIDSTAPKSKFIRPYSVHGVCTAYFFNVIGPDNFMDISNGHWNSGFCIRQ
ncbi:MAG: hypothetical protein KAQ98_00390 [Bacteriovoracaceae bacterium]|nr:hypothetical protein [Bacteriovoracaceae bacterium]